MKKVKIVYSYDGSKFEGFQRIPHKKTVQGELEKVIYLLFNEKIQLVSSGRTDRNVHAIEQVSDFTISKKISLKSIKYNINKAFKGTLIIRDIAEVSDEFHSRYSVKSRTYLYRLSKDIDVFHTDYVSKIEDDIEIEKFFKIISKFVGKHDFTSFCKKNIDVNSNVREILSIEMKKNNNEYHLFIKGTAFLHSMIRIITKTALDVYFNRLPITYIEDMLNNPKEDIPKRVASPNGLYLYKIEY